MSEMELPEIKLERDSLYREESFTDRKAGILRRLTPIDDQEQRDKSRPILWLGQTQLMTQVGPLPISFEIEAETLSEAIDQFSEAAKFGIQKTITEMQEARREQASSIVVPGSNSMPRGGIQMP